MDLSIIVPVYNVEEYIRPCFESIFRQGLDEKCFEVIIVNDGTKDRSIEVIQDIIEQHKNIIVLNQQHQGLSVARNNGIAIAKGKYILMPDSDDLLIENSLKPLLEKAIEYEADLVVADFLRMTNEEINNLQVIPQEDLSTQEKTGEQLFLEDLNPYHCYVWRTLYKRSFLLETNLKFYPGIRYQDVPFTHECYLKAGKCLRTNQLLIIYRRRSGSATYSFNVGKARDFSTAIGKTWELITLDGISSAVKEKIRSDMWESFSEMLRLTFRYIKKDKERVKVIDYIRENAHDLDFKNGKKQRLTTFLLRRMPHTFICLRYYYKLIIEDRFLPFYYHRLRRPSTKI